MADDDLSDDEQMEACTDAWDATEAKLAGDGTRTAAEDDESDEAEDEEAISSITIPSDAEIDELRNQIGRLKKQYDALETCFPPCGCPHAIRPGALYRVTESYARGQLNEADGSLAPLGQNVRPDQVTGFYVQGAGEAMANGLYAKDEDHELKPRYKLAAHSPDGVPFEYYIQGADAARGHKRWELVRMQRAVGAEAEPVVLYATADEREAADLHRRRRARGAAADDALPILPGPTVQALLTTRPSLRRLSCSTAVSEAPHRGRRLTDRRLAQLTTSKDQDRVRFEVKLVRLSGRCSLAGQLHILRSKGHTKTWQALSTRERSHARANFEDESVEGQGLMCLVGPLEPARRRRRWRSASASGWGSPRANRRGRKGSKRRQSNSTSDDDDDDSDAQSTSSSSSRRDRRGGGEGGDGEAEAALTQELQALLDEDEEALKGEDHLAGCWLADIPGRKKWFNGMPKEWPGRPAKEGDVVGVAADAARGILWVGINGVWEEVLPPNDRPLPSLYPVVMADAGNELRVNLGAKPFHHEPPPDAVFRQVSQSAGLDELELIRGRSQRLPRQPEKKKEVAVIDKGDVSGDLRWVERGLIEPNHIKLAAGDWTKVIMTSKSSRGAGAIGRPAMKNGVHTFTYTIEDSKNGDGNKMYLGVADATAGFLADEDADGRQAWGFSPFDGTLFVTTTSQAGGRRKHLRKDLMNGYNLRSNCRAIKATVKVIVNCVKHTLAFSVNDRPEIEADIRLPDVVVPWVSMAAEGDAISFTDYECADFPVPSEWMRDTAEDGQTFALCPMPSAVQAGRDRLRPVSGLLPAEALMFTRGGSLFVLPADEGQSEVTALNFEPDDECAERGGVQAAAALERLMTSAGGVLRATRETLRVGSGPRRAGRARSLEAALRKGEEVKTAAEKANRWSAPADMTAARRASGSFCAPGSRRIVARAEEKAGRAGSAQEGGRHPAIPCVCKGGREEGRGGRRG